MAESLNAGTNTISKAQFLKTLKGLVEINRRLADLRSDSSEAREVKRGILSAAEGHGANKKGIKLLETLSEIDDDDERIGLMTETMRYAEWAEVPLFRPPSEDQPQGALFEDDQETLDAKQALRDATIYNDGWNSAKSGALSDNPHPAGSRDHQTWTKGFGDHLHDRQVQQFGAAGGTKTASTERRPRDKADGSGKPAGAAKAAKPGGGAKKAGAGAGRGRKGASSHAVN